MIYCGNTISFLFNYAPHYREAVYALIDKSLDCRFYFGDSIVGSIEKLDYNIFSRPVKEFRVQMIKGGWCYYKNALSVLRDGADTYVLTGDMRNLSNWLILLLLKLFYPRKRSAIWTHGVYGKESKLQLFIKKVFYSLTDAIFCYGDRSKSLMVEAGIKADKIFPIHNSLDYENQDALRPIAEDRDFYRRHFGNNNPTLVFTGRLTKVKRLDMILDAMTVLRTKGEKYNLVIVGDGTQKMELTTKAESLGLSDSVWFYGACYDESELSKLIYNADLCVSPGNVGLTSIHSMTYGTPVVTHDRFELQMPEFEAIKSGKTGDFFDYGSIDSLSATISNWFRTNRDNREQVREQCYQEIDANWTPAFQLEVLKAAIEKMK